MLTIRDNVLWDTNAKEKWRNPRPATVNWVSNASRAVPKTTDVDLANIIFLATTATSLPTVSLQRCAEKGKLALHGAKEVVTTPYPVNILTVLWKIKWLSLKSKNVFFLKGQYHLTYFIGPCFTLIYRKSIKILLIYKLEWKKPILPDLYETLGLFLIVLNYALSVILWTQYQKISYYFVTLSFQWIKMNRMDGFYYRIRYVCEKNKADNGQDSLKFIHYVILFVAKISSV